MTTKKKVDETYIDGRTKNVHVRQRPQHIHGHGAADKTVLVRVKDRYTGKVAAKVVAGTDGMTLRGFVTDHSAKSAKHLDRCVAEFAGRRNRRPLDTKVRIPRTAAGMAGKRLRRAELIAP